MSAANYSFNFVNGTLTVAPVFLSVWANDASRGYGAANPVFTLKYVGFVNGETSNMLSGTPSLTTVATPASPVAFYTITTAQGTLVNATNYTYNFINGTLTVTQAVLTVTANNRSRAYGAANPAFTASYSGFVNGDNNSVLSGSPSLTTSATTNSSPGNYAITAALGTLSAANYSFTFVNGTLTVNSTNLTILSLGITNKVVTVTWSSVSGSTYGLQSNTNLTGTNWVSILPNVTATGTTASQTNAFSNVPHQYYRVTLISSP